jgi:hypothetical protein
MNYYLIFWQGSKHNRLLQNQFGREDLVRINGVF